MFSLADAVGCAGAKGPYLKGNFIIEGIPDGIQWKKKDGRIKKPTDYGQTHIEEIMKDPGNVKFVISSSDKEATDQRNISPELENQPPASFLRITSKDIVMRAMKGGEKIKASEIDALVSLRENEQKDLERYLWCFSQEARESFRKKNEKLGIIVPTFTISVKKFWLFLYAGKLSEIGNLDDQQNIPGKWLEKVKGCQYRELSDVAVIKKLNIIKHADGEIIAFQDPKKDKANHHLVSTAFVATVKQRLGDMCKN